MNNMTTSKEVNATKMSVEIQGLTPGTNYYAAVLVKFPLNGKVCEIDGTLRGERIQKRLFTNKCPKGKISNILQDWISQEGFNISWKEEAYAKHCNYTYEVKVERVSDGKEIYNKILKNPSHSQDGLETYTEYRVSIAVVSESGKSDPSITTIKTLPKRPTTPPSPIRIFEDSGSVTYKWNRPSDVEGNIRYRYTYEVKPIACGEETENPAGKETEATEVSFPKPLPYARVTFRIAIGNEAGFSGYKEMSHQTNPEVPAVKVENINCSDYQSRKECRVTLEKDCQKNNGRDLDIEAVWEYKTNSARDPKSGKIHEGSFRRENTHEHYIIEFPPDFYHYTTYQLAVYVKNEAGTNESSRCSSEKIITPPVAPGKVKIIRSVSAHSSIDLGWDPAPSFPPTGDIEEYVINVYKTPDRTFIRTIHTPNESYFIHNLEPDVSYTIYVSGINEGVEEPGEAAVTVIATVAQRPTTPPSLERIFEDSGSVTYKWNRPSDVEGNISYKYTYEVKPIACGEATEIPADNYTQATAVSFPKPLPYSRVTFRIAIGNEAGFSGYQEISHQTDPEAIKVEKIDCGDYKSRKQCSVTLENDCRKNNGKDLDIEAVWEYKTNSARDPKSGDIQAVYFSAQNLHNYIIELPRDLYHHTTYQLAVYVKNEAGTNKSSRYLSEKIITPPVAPGKVKITRIVSSHSSLDSGWDPKLSFPPTGDINGYVIDLGWDPLPSFPPTGNINGYVIEVYETRHREFIGGFVVADESCVISYLDPDVSYTIHVSGINEGVPQPGEAAIIVVSTLAYKPSQPINFLQDSSLSCNAQWDDENIPLSEDLIFQNEDYSISEKEHKEQCD
ncbi:fibronectin type-III domain-containing protein 3a-like isoform X2 [Palaemon carinicauda]|uniref:fibronectin type-III domain-containing protein 3a-like isoform X2 n=1 Tax=Palaemon carinicauda TaxID=392227 RepID=UPI0035B60E79